MNRPIVLALLISLVGAPLAFAGEHPHPTKEAEKAAADQKKDEAKAQEKGDEATKGEEAGKDEKAKENKKSKAKKSKEKAASTWNANQVEKDLISFVQGKSSQTGGKFVVNDDVVTKTRQMTLSKIHTEKIMQLKDGTSFVCADFKDASGDTVDLDFFMKPTTEGSVDEVTQVQIHKVNGKQRFTYVFEGGKWLQKAVN